MVSLDCPIGALFEKAPPGLVVVTVDGDNDLAVFERIRATRCGTRELLRGLSARELPLIE